MGKQAKNTRGVEQKKPLKSEKTLNIFMSGLADVSKPGPTNTVGPALTYIHLKDTGHAFKTEDVVILDREERYRGGERGIKEAIWEHVENPHSRRKVASASSYPTRGTGPFGKFRVVSTHDLL